MNNQRRHELEQNVLADKLGAGVETIHPLIKPVGIVALLGIVGMLGYQFYNGQNSKKASKEWTEYYFNRTSGDAESFEALGQAFSNSVTGQWAKHSAARGFLTDGIEALYSNRKEAVENIRKAITEWESVKDSSISELRVASIKGLAQAHESLGELDEAVKYLGQFADLPSTSEDQRKAINEQISYLKTGSAKGFYDWFNKLDPKPAAPPTISGDLSKPPTSPSITLDPKDLPDLGAPTINPSGTPKKTDVPAGGLELNTPPDAKPADPVVPVIEAAKPVPATPEPTAPLSTEPAPTVPAAEPAKPSLELSPPTEPTVAAPANPGPAPVDLPK